MPSSPSLSLPHLRSSLSSVLDPISPAPFKLISASHPRWPLLPRSSSPSSSQSPNPKRKGPRTISILDSSWNPPTNAHLSLVTAPLPGFEGGEEEGEYDALLLLLSVKNVDKTLKSGDASFEQRLQMIHLLASSLLLSASQTSSSPRSHSNLAIGILSEPAFIAKDVVVRTFLQEHARTTLERNVDGEEDRKELEEGETRLAWLVGTDTLWRFFDGKYYPLSTTSTSLLQTLSPFFTPPPTPNSSHSHPGSLLIHFPRLPSPPAPPSFDLAVLEALPRGSVRVGRSREGKDWGRVSSTAVRTGVKEGRGLEETEGGLELVDEGVRVFLEGEGLYR